MDENEQKNCRGCGSSAAFAQPRSLSLPTSPRRCEDRWEKPPPYPLAGSRQFRSLPPAYRGREEGRSLRQFQVVGNDKLPKGEGAGGRAAPVHDAGPAEDALVPSPPGRG